MEEDYCDILMTYLRVTQTMSHQFRSHFGQMHLTLPQALVLDALKTKGPMPITGLAEITGSANSTVSGIVDRLEKLDLAKRERSERDRRVIYVSVTERYRAVCTEEKIDVGGYFASLLDTMSGQEKAEVLTALQRLNTALLKNERKE